MIYNKKCIPKFAISLVSLFFYNERLGDSQNFQVHFFIFSSIWYVFLCPRGLDSAPISRVSLPQAEGSISVLQCSGTTPFFWAVQQLPEEKGDTDFGLFEPANCCGLVLPLHVSSKGFWACVQPGRLWVIALR